VGQFPERRGAFAERRARVQGSRGAFPRVRGAFTERLGAVPGRRGAFPQGRGRVPRASGGSRSRSGRIGHLGVSASLCVCLKKRSSGVTAKPVMEERGGYFFKKNTSAGRPFPPSAGGRSGAWTQRSLRPLVPRAMTR